MAPARDSLPINSVLPDLLAALSRSGAVVLRAPTGAGKTTRVPPALIEDDGRVLVLEPRRVAVRAAARRMAAEHSSPLGDVFGYHVRFDRKAGSRTRVLVVTPGVLLRMMHDDPFLESTSAVIFDEFHERGIEADLALGLVRLVRQTVRPELKVVVMSATVEPGPVSAYFSGCPTVESEGRAFPIEIQYRPARREVPIHEVAASAVERVLNETPGDVLVFLPGLREIRSTAELLERTDAEVLPLHGDLPPEAQDRALRKLERRKIVLATNVAETSVTVDGVTAVVDTGLARQMEFDASVGLDRLRLVPISRASADQRAGRAGRTQPGVCVRLWDELSHRSRPEQTEPEIRRVDLAGPVLHLLALGERDVRAFPWLDEPKPEAVEQALTLLEQLQALQNGKLTEVGQIMARLPVHPRLGRLLVEGQRLGYANRAALAAALLSERDPFVREFDGSAVRTAPPTESDILDRVEALEQFERNGQLDTLHCRLHRGGAKAVLAVRDQLLRREEPNPPAPFLKREGGEDEAVLRAIFAAFPDRIARRRERNDRRAIMVGGRGVRLGTGSGVMEPDLFVCVDVDAGGADSFVRLASGVRREWLPAESITTRIEVIFDEQTERLAARKFTRFADLVLDEKDAHIADEGEAAGILAGAAANSLQKVLPSPDSDAGRFLTRLRCLRAWMPELNLPELDGTAHSEVLESLARGRRSLADIRNGPWLDVLRGSLTYAQLQTVEREAPDRLAVPSGSQIKLEYEEGRPPVLAVRIQELFGLADTPRIAGGRVKVLFHLLAPNYRPQQVTEDLASFWANTYPQVRKELRARYPKHSWPDNPLTAPALRGTKRRTE